MCETTNEMIEAGVSVLWDLEGEVPKDYLARAVFEAMDRVRCQSKPVVSLNTESLVRQINDMQKFARDGGYDESDLRLTFINDRAVEISLGYHP